MGEEAIRENAEEPPIVNPLKLSPLMVYYRVTLDKSSGKGLGLDVDYQAEDDALVITALTEGLSRDWNARCEAGRLLKVGDSIIEVNGQKGVRALLKTCKNDTLLHMVIR